ncbi:MAG TPA: DinB family protein [bacterium]|nr:DinB family protein [bacterium]
MSRDAHAAARVDFAHFFDYLVLARGRLLDWTGAQPAHLYTRPYPFGLGSIRATLIHIADIEWGYVQRLAGRDYTRAESPFTAERYPTLPALSAAWQARRAATRAVLAALGDPSRTIEYVSRNFTPPRRTRTTAGGLAGQLLFHEVHHRAQVMTMLRLAGVPAQDLDYSRLMWDRTSVNESD